jgi:lipid-A-disaccharide synthase
MYESAKRIMIVTGEASGDLHGANLIKAVNALSADTRFFGAGGQRMAAAGCDILIPGEDLAVMGVFEVLGQLPVIWRSFQRLKRELSGRQKPDALVLIDFPDFNLRLANQAKKAGVPVLYYISPKVWAWRQGRVKKIAERVDSLAVIFPFEPALYDGLDVLVKYVGHPLLDEFAASCGGVDLRQELQIPETKKIVGLFPGSRRSELRYMLDIIVESAKLIIENEPNAHFLVPIANSLKKEGIKSRFTSDFPVTFIETGNTTIYDIASSCDTIISVSGTVTLQIALAGTPMAILYRTSPMSYEIGSRLVKVDHAGLPNIVANRRIAPEFIQDEATPEALANEALHVLTDAAYADKMRDDLLSVQKQLGDPGCSIRVAEMLFALLSQKKVN